MTSYFKPSETQCKCGCGMDIQPQLLNKLNQARVLANTAFAIKSGARCVKHNAAERGKKNSAHLRGLAVDIKYKNSAQKFAILKALFDVGFNRLGDNQKLMFIHCDIDTSLPQDVFFNY